MKTDRSYIYIKKSVLENILPLGLSLREIGLKLNIAPKTVLRKLRYHGLIGETETLKEAYKRMGIKTNQRRNYDKKRKEILNYFKPIFFSTMARYYKGTCTDKITNETMVYFQSVMDKSGLLQPPVFPWKIREMMKDILNPEARNIKFYDSQEEEEEQKEIEKQSIENLEEIIKESKEERKNRKKKTVRRGPKPWSLVKYILKTYPNDPQKINFSKMSQHFNGIHPQNIKKILEYYHIDPYNIDLYKQEVIATIKIACHEVNIKKKNQRENATRLAQRLKFINENDFLKMCEVLEIDWKQIYVDALKDKLDYFAEKGYKNKEICSELNISEIKLNKFLSSMARKGLINKVK